MNRLKLKKLTAEIWASSETDRLFFNPKWHVEYVLKFCFTDPELLSSDHETRLTAAEGNIQGSILYVVEQWKLLPSASV